MAKKKHRESATARMRQRRKLICEMYFQRYAAPEIADALIERGEYQGTAASCLRIVQREVKALREAANPEAIVSLQRPAEIDRYRKGLESIMQAALADALDTTTVAREKVSPRGSVVTVQEERLTNTERVQNRKLAVDILKTLAKLDNLVSEKGQGVDLPTGEEEREKEKPAFIQFSGKPQEYLIAENLGGKDVN